MKIQVVIEATSIQEYTEAIQALAAGYTVAPTINLDAVVNTGTLKSGTEKTNAPVENTYAEASDILKKSGDTIPGTLEDKPKLISAKSVKRLNDKVVSLDDETLENLFAEFNISAVSDLLDCDLRKFDAALNKALKEAEAEEKEIVKEAQEQQKEAEEVLKDAEESDIREVSFVDVKARAIKHGKLPDGKADVKFVLEKLGAAKLSDIKEDQYATFMSELDILEDLDKQPSEEVQASNDETQNEDAAEDKPVTIEMIRAKAKELSVAGYKEEIKAVLKELGAPSLTKIPKEQYDAFYNALGNI